MGHILIVEDSATQAEELQFLLEDAGFEVTRACDGIEALRTVRLGAPDLIVTDLMMPGMDGLALVEAIRHDYPYVPVVLVTAFGSEDTAVRALRAGAASYVPKRNLSFDLVPTLRDILEVAVGEASQRAALRCLTSVESRFRIENDPRLVTPLVRHLEEGLATVGACDSSELIRIGVALREAIINAIEHGNLELDPGLRRGHNGAYAALAERRRRELPYRERCVHLTASLTPQEATYVIRDDGPGLDPARLPNPDDPANLSESNGRGLVLMSMFMDEVKLGGRGNEIILRKRGLAAAAH